MDYYYPNFLSAEMRNNMVWLTLRPKKVLRVKTDVRTDEGSVGTSAASDPTRFVALGDSYNFLMPDDISLSISHTWKDFASVVGAFREIYSELSKQYGSSVKPIAKILSRRNGWGKTFEEITTMDINAADLGQKNDSPIVYENSTRKTLSLELELSCYNDCKTDVFDPIQKLLNLSSATMLSSVVKFEFPYVFDVTTTVGGLVTPFIHIKNGAIVSINPEFRAPYIKGYASSASLTLQFEDIDPLYRSEAWGDTVTVSTSMEPVGPPNPPKTNIAAKNSTYYTSTPAPPPTRDIEVENFDYYTAYANKISRVAGIGRVELQNLPYYQSIVPLVGSSLNTVL